MPHFNTVNSIKISDYFNLQSHQTQNLFKKLGLETEEQIKKAIVLAVIGDKIDLYYAYKEAEYEYAEAVSYYDNFKEQYDQKKEHTPQEEAMLNSRLNSVNTCKTALDNAKAPIADYLEGDKFNFKKAFDEKKAKTEDGKKMQADEVARFFILSLYDADLKSKFKDMMEIPVRFDEYLSKEESKILSDDAKDKAQKYTNYELDEIVLDDSNKIEDTYKKNKKLEDRLMFTLIHRSKKVMYEELVDDDDNDYEINKLDEKEEDLLDSEIDDFIKNIKLNSIEDIKNYLNKMAEIRARLTCEAGKEIQNLSNMLDGEDFRDNKALALYTYDEFHSPAKMLLKQFDEVYRKTIPLVHDKIKEFNKVTEETTYGEAVSLMELDDENRAVFNSYYAIDQNESIKVGKLYDERDLRFINNKIATNLFNKYEKEAKEAQSKAFEKASGYSLGKKLEKKENDYYLDEQWAEKFSKKFLKKAHGKNNQMLFKKFGDYVASGKSFGLTNGNEFFNTLSDGIPKFEEPPYNVDEVGHILTNIEIKSAILPKRVDAWEKAKKERPKDKKLLSLNVVEELDKDINKNDLNKDPNAGKVSRAQAEPDYSWMDNFFTLEYADSKENFKKKEILQFNSRFKLNLMENVKTSSAKLASSIIPNKKQEEAYRLMGLEDVPNSARLAHYYLYVLATKPGLDLKNLRKICEDPELKNEYLDFCADNSYKNEYNAVKVWGKIFKDAASKLKDYVIPDIDYNDPYEIQRNAEELYALRTISKNASTLADKMFKEDAKELISVEEKYDVMEAPGFLEHIGFLTHSLDDGWFVVPTLSKKKYAHKALLSIAANRFLAGKRMELVRGKTLGEAAESVSKSDAFLNIMSDKQYVTSQLKTAFKTEDTADYLALDPDVEHLQKIEKTFEVNESTKKNAFTVVMRNNMELFRRYNGLHTSDRQLNEKLVKNMNKVKSVEEMMDILNDVHRDYYRNIRAFIDYKFNALFTPEIRAFLKSNKIDIMDVITIDGMSAKEAYGPLYADVKDPADRERLIQMEVLKAYYDSRNKVEIKNYNIDENGRLVQAGMLGFYATEEEVEKIAKLSSEYKEVNKSFLSTLKPLKQRLIRLLPRVDGERDAEKEERFLTGGTDLYQYMAQSLQKVIELLDDKKASPIEIRNALEELQANAAIYYKERKGILFGPRKGKGTGRLEVSKYLRATLPNMIMTYDNMMKSTELTYSFGASSSTPMTASIEELDKEINLISNNVGHSLDITDEKIEEYTKSAKENADATEAKAHAIRNIIDFMRRNYKGNIKADYTVKDPDQMIEDVTNATAVDTATAKVYRNLLKEVFKEDCSVYGAEFVLAELKLGNVAKDIEKLSTNPEYKINTINRLHDFNEVAAVQRNVVKVEQEHAKAMYDQRMQYYNKYRSLVGGQAVGILTETYGKDVFKQMRLTADKTNYSISRTAVSTIAILAMALEQVENRDKYTIEQLMDTDQLKNEKEQKIKEIFELMVRVGNKENDPNDAKEANKELARYLYYGSKKLTEKCDELANQINFDDEYFDCTKEFAIMTAIGGLQYDGWQEFKHCSEEVIEIHRQETGMRPEEFYSYDLFSEDFLRTLNPASGNYTTMPHYAKAVNFLEGKGGREMSVNLIKSVTTMNVTRQVFKDWNKENKKKPIPFSQWSLKNNANAKTVLTFADITGPASDMVSDYELEELSPIKDQVIDGTLLSDISIEIERKSHAFLGFYGLPGADTFYEELNYKPRVSEIIIKTNEKLKNYDKELVGASDIRKKYINSAKNAVNALSKYLMFGLSINSSRKEAIKNCYAAIIQEKWCKVFEEKGYTGEDLVSAVKNATEYTMKHKPYVTYATNKYSIGALALEYKADELVNDCDEGIFMGEAALAANRLLKGNYRGREDDLVRDVAYCRTAQILRINEYIPNDADTDKKITCRQYFNTLLKSGPFKNSLRNVNPDNGFDQDNAHLGFRSPVQLLKETFDDSQITKEIRDQENAVYYARKEKHDREIEARLARQNAIDAENARRQGGVVPPKSNLGSKK